VATLGGSAIIKGAVKTGIKQNGKHLAKGIVKAESKVLLNQFSTHTIDDAVSIVMKKQ